MRAWRTTILAYSILIGAMAAAPWLIGRAHAEAAFVEGQTANGGNIHTFSTERQTVSDAINTAMSDCAQHAFNCHVLRQFHTTCFALAYATRGGYGSGFGSDPTIAHRVALQGCINANPYDNCNIVKSFCDTTDQQVIEQTQRAIADAEQKAEYDDYLRNWDGCQLGHDLAACDRALPMAKTENDRNHLSTWRNSILTAQANEEERRKKEEERRKNEEEKKAALETYSADLQRCAGYDTDACDRALRSSLSTAYDQSNLRGWKATAAAYAFAKTACQNGGVTACDEAQASPAGTVSDHALIKEWRAAATPLARATAALGAFGRNTVPLNFILPLSILLGITLLVMFAERAGQKRASASAESFSRPERPPTLEPPTPLQPPSLPQIPPSSSLVVVETPLVPAHRPPVLSIDTPAALRALKLAGSYLKETADHSFSDPDEARTARTTLSLASRQLDIAHAADPHAKLELEDGTLIPQARLRARVLTQEALTWGSENLKRAATIAERAAAADPTFADAFSTLGLFHFHNRNRSAAADALTRALELDPENIETQKLLDRTENMGLAEIATYKATKTGVKAINTGIGVYNAGVYTWNVVAFTWNVITWPLRTMNRIFNFITGGK